MTAKSNAANQAAYRARKRASALLEVRGIFARTELHQTIKALARVLADANAHKPADSPTLGHLRDQPEAPVVDLDRVGQSVQP
jgi:hypothetical protein